MRKLVLSIMILFLTFVSGTVMAQYGPVGFVNTNEGINGITGGMGGEIVRVNTREQLAHYAIAPEPYIIIVEGRMEGNGLNRKKDIIEVGSNKTIVGVKGAELAGIGLDIKGKENIIIRNLIIHHADPDGIAARSSHHIWVDHCDVYSEDEPVKEDWDGLVDLTVGSSYLTVSYCYIHDHHKACLLNSGTMHFYDNGKNRATYHHNAFMRTDQRNPRIGYGLGHVFSNYYQNIGTYAIGVHTQAQVMSEQNYFDQTVNHPFENLYAHSTDEASCGFMADRNSYFGKALAQNFKYQLTGSKFLPSAWYDYDFALTEPKEVAALYPSKVGPVEGLENEPILWPGNGATDIQCNVSPTFSSIEGMTKAEIYMGTDPKQLKRMEKTKISLRPSTTYYWYVKAFTKKGKHTSPLYRFTTAAEKAAKPYPVDGERNAQLRVAPTAESKTLPMSLSWRPAAIAESYKVYFATTKEELDHSLIGEAATTSFNPGTLLYGQKYYWRVDAVRADGSIVRGDIWTFSSPARYIQEGRTEMEHLARSAYAYLERNVNTRFKGYTASNDTVTVGEVGPGAMTGIWQGKEGTYQVSVTFYDEASGQAWMGLSVNDKLIDSWLGERVEGLKTHKVPKGVSLKPGDQIRIDFYTHRRMRCRIDCMDIVR